MERKKQIECLSGRIRGSFLTMMRNFLRAWKEFRIPGRDFRVSSFKNYKDESEKNRCRGILITWRMILGRVQGRVNSPTFRGGITIHGAQIGASMVFSRVNEPMSQIMRISLIGFARSIGQSFIHLASRHLPGELALGFSRAAGTSTTSLRC